MMIDYRLLTAASLIAIASPATAQTTGGTAPVDAQAGSAEQAPEGDRAASDADREATDAIGDIVVTAQRRAERLQDVPLSVTAISNADLNRLRITDPSRLQFLTPGLTFGQQGSDAFPAIRGVRTQLVSAQTDPVVGFYLDGIYQSRTQQQTIPLFDVARVEVQRGPQGTLYGRNTFGGNISVVNNEPTNRFDAGVNAQVGNYDLLQFDGFVNLPVSDQVQFRVAASHIEHDGYVRAAGGFRLVDEYQTAVRGSVKVQLTEQIEIDARAGYWRRDDTGGGAFGYRVGGTLINLATGRRSINGSPVAVNPTVMNGTNVIAGISTGVSVTSDPYTNSWDYEPFNRVKQYYGSGSIAFDFGFATLRSITGYTNFRAFRSADLDQTSVVFPAAGVTAGFPASGIQSSNTATEQTTQEVQLASAGSSRFEWIIGGYYFYDRIDEVYTQPYTSPTATANGTRSRTLIDTKAYAAYAQGSYELVEDTLKVIGGIRYSEESKDFRITNFIAPPRTLIFTQTPSQAAGAPEFDKITWRAGLEYKPARDNLLYATVSTGFESGGINNNAANPAVIPISYAPQTVTAYEVGSKNTLMGGRAILNVSAFYNDFKNLQITILDFATNLSYFSSAGAGRAYGAEVELRSTPLPNFHVDLTGAYLDAEFTRYTRPNPFFNATNGDPVTISLAGKDIPMSPRFKGTAAVYYDFELSGGGTVTPFVNVLYSTKYFSTDYNTPIDRQNSYALLDASLRYVTPDQKLYFEVFGNNLTDKAVIYSSTVGNNQRIQQSFGAPRLYGIRAGLKY